MCAWVHSRPDWIRQYSVTILCLTCETILGVQSVSTYLQSPLATEAATLHESCSQTQAAALNFFFSARKLDVMPEAVGVQLPNLMRAPTSSTSTQVRTS